LDPFEPVYPTAVPIRGECPPSTKFVFVRSVAIFTLNLLQEDQDESVHIDFSLLSNKELEEELCAQGAICDELLGGVVYDGAPNGFINVN
jgi:hypothetical protein